MTKFVALFSNASIGGTFVDWSLNFLNGRDYFFQVNNQQWEKLSVNPINKTNSHGHNKNQPAGLKNLEILYNRCYASSVDLVTLYALSQYTNEAITDLGLDTSNIVASDVPRIIEQRQFDYAAGFDFCANWPSKIIFLALDNDLSLFSYFKRSQEQGPFKAVSEVPKNQVDFFLLEEQVYFPKNDNLWPQTDHIWDVRERKALNMRPYDFVDLTLKFNPSTPKISTQYTNLVNHGLAEIIKIMDYCELTIDLSRLDHWSSVFTQWQNIQKSNIRFIQSIDWIIDSIINNRDLDISDLVFQDNNGMLSFDQEALIQHLLIYKHNLNLKTWNLDQLPTNCQSIHALLESNIHKIDSIY